MAKLRYVLLHCGTGSKSSACAADEAVVAMDTAGCCCNLAIWEAVVETFPPETEITFLQKALLHGNVRVLNWSDDAV